MTVITLATEMVISTCWGGYGLSRKASEEIAKRKGLAFRFDEASRSSFIGHGFQVAADLPRTDPDLIAVVRELGALANGESAELKIVEVTINIDVVSHDGKERVTVNGGAY